MFLVVPLEAGQFERDMTLVMVHCDASVIITGDRLGKHRIRWHRTFNNEALGHSFFYRRDNLGDLFVPEKSGVACMRIKTGDADPPVSDTQLIEAAVQKTDDFQDPLLFYE